MGAIGTGAMLQGINQGIDKGMARRDLATQRDRTDQQYQQQQSDRSYALKRRGITDSRLGEQYNRKRDMQQRDDEINNVMRDGISSNWNNLDEIAKVANKYTGIKHIFGRDAQGNPTLSMEHNGKATPPQVVTPDQIGTGLQALKMNEDPYNILKKKKDIELKRKEAKTKYTRSINKMEREYVLKGGLERQKESIKEGGATGGLKAQKFLMSADKELSKRSMAYYGTAFGDQFSFDNDQKRQLASGFSKLGSLYLRTDPNAGLNTAGSKSLRFMKTILKNAKKQAATEGLEEGSKDYDNRIYQLVNFQADTESKRLSKLQKISSTAPKLSRNKAGQPKPNKKPVLSNFVSPKTGKKIPQQSIDLVKNNPALKDNFDKNYGEGAYASAINEKGGSGGNKTEGGISKPVMSEAEKRKKIEGNKVALKKKQHNLHANGRKASSEYRTKWKNMSDNEKVLWMKENGAFLKYEQSRLWEKANSDVRRIKSRKRFSPEGEADTEKKRQAMILKRREK